MLKYRSSIETVQNDKSGKPDYVYININILNSTQGQNFFSHNPQINYNDSLQFDIVDNPNDYLFFISRFSCESGVLLPIWTPEIADNQPDKNLCVYNITLSVVKGGNTYTQTTYMEYQPETNTTQPIDTLLKNDTNHYYYVYTFSHIVYLFNNMLTKCFNDLQTKAGGAFTASCPFMNYDPSSGLFSLYFDTNGEQFTLSFDSNLYNMFNSFYFRNTNQLVVDSNNGLNNISINGKTYIKVSQDFISTSMWSPIETLVFTTTKIPIVPEQNTKPLSFNDFENLTNIGTIPQQFQKIITDISLPVDKASDWRSFITYVPAFPRYINLNSSGELKEIDISLFFQDKNTGQLVPVCLGNGGCVNLKLAFKRKYIV